MTTSSRCSIEHLPKDIAATIYTALGIPLGLERCDGLNQPYVLCTVKAIGAVLG